VIAFDRMLVQVRERSFLEILDLALVVVRRRPLALGLAAVAGIAPFAAINGWLRSGPDPMSPWMMLWLTWLEAPLATAPLTVVLGGMMFGNRPSARQVASTILRSAWALFCYQVVLRGIVLVIVPLWPLVPARMGFLDEVILLERGPLGQATRRSSDLSSEAGGELFVRWIGQLFFGLLFVVCFRVGGDSIWKAMTSGIVWDPGGSEATFEAWFDPSHPLTRVGIWIAIAFFGVSRFLTYIDRRIRLEGWEVELRLRAVGAALRREAEGW